MASAARRPPGARLLLGSSAMAGALLRVRAAAFDRATHATGVARLRIRTLLDLPSPDARGGRELVVRLGAHDGEPDAIEVIEVVSDEARPWLMRAEAHLCGPDADPHPLSVKVRTKGASSSMPAGAASRVAPILSVRHATDDLCVRFWTVDGR